MLVIDQVYSLTILMIWSHILSFGFAFEICVISPSFERKSIPSFSEPVSSSIVIFSWNTLKPFAICKQASKWTTRCSIFNNPIDPIVSAVVEPSRSLIWILTLYLFPPQTQITDVETSKCLFTVCDGSIVLLANAMIDLYNHCHLPLQTRQSNVFMYTARHGLIMHNIDQHKNWLALTNAYRSTLPSCLCCFFVSPLLMFSFLLY